MGRGKVELKRIENKISRQVTFSKRKSGLLKKANEISVMCEAEVAAIVFSTKGKLFHYSTNHSSMERIIEKYEEHYADKTLAADSKRKENSYVDPPKLLARVELLQRNIRNYGGEDLDPLSLRELQSLQQQLHTALKRIRTKKNQLMLESISHLNKQKRSLQDQNLLLEMKVREMEKQQMVEHADEDEDAQISFTSTLHPNLNICCGSQLPSMTAGEGSDEAVDSNAQHSRRYSTN